MHMQMKIHIFGMGVSIAKTGFGANLASGAFIALRRTKHDSQPYFVFTIGDHLSLGSKSGTLIASNIETEWFDIDPKANSWLSNVALLTGRNGEISVTGAIFGNGKVDIKFILFTDNNNIKTLVNKVDIKCGDGLQFQLADTRVRGTIKMIPLKH